MSKPYNIELYEQTEAIRQQTRAGEINREERFAKLDVISTQYAVAHAALNDMKYDEARRKAEDTGRNIVLPPLNLMDAQALNRLADLCLYEELTDKSQYKTRDTEYPFLSEMQMARRAGGAHERNTGVQKGEAPFTNAETIATNGRNYAVPKRRKRSIHEDLLRDEQAMIRNKERRRKYNEFTEIQPVKTYKIGEFVS